MEFFTLSTGLPSETSASRTIFPDLIMFDSHKSRIWSVGTLVGIVAKDENREAFLLLMDWSVGDKSIVSEPV